MVIHNESKRVHEIRLKILSLCASPKIITDLVKELGLGKSCIEKHLASLVLRGLIERKPYAHRYMTEYKAIASDYEWVPSIHEVEAAPPKHSYGKNGIYLLADRPASMEKYPLRKQQRNAVSGSTLGGAYFDY